MSSRRAFTLLETLLAIGIIALLVGLILPVVQKIRLAAMQTQSKNNLRQIIMGLHNYASAHDDDRTPGCVDWLKRDANDEPVPFLAMADYYEVKVDRGPFDRGGPSAFRVPLFIDPADPTWAIKPNITDGREGNCSYAFNLKAFEGPSRTLSAGFPDGLSQTIGFASHYMRCGQSSTGFTQFVAGSQFIWQLSDSDHGAPGRRASFADAYYGDVIPVTDLGSHTSKPSRPGATFQSAPAIADCDSLIPQSAYSSGLPVALMDGSVRTLSKSVEPSVFWAAITRNGGEVVNLD